MSRPCLALPLTSCRCHLQIDRDVQRALFNYEAASLSGGRGGGGGSGGSGSSSGAGKCGGSGGGSVDAADGDRSGDGDGDGDGEGDDVVALGEDALSIDREASGDAGGHDIGSNPLPNNTLILILSNHNRVFT